MPTGKRRDASWSDLKAKLAALDRSELIALLRDLYAASKENQAFLHTRFGGGGGRAEAVHGRHLALALTRRL